MPTSVLGSSIDVASPKMGAGKMFDRRQITLFCLEKRRSKHKMTIFSKNIWGAMASLPPLATPVGRRPEHGSFIRSSPPVLTKKGWYCFVTNNIIKIFPSQNKFIEAWRRQTPRIFEKKRVKNAKKSEKCVDPLNAAKIFNVHAFLHGLCK